MFDIMLDNNFKRSRIIFELFVDYVAGVLILSLRIMLRGAEHYNLLFYFYYVHY